MPDFLPRRDADLSERCLAFARTLAAAPEAYPINAQRIADCLAAAQAFRDAFMAAANLATRSAAIVRRKDDARASVTRIVREVAKMVRADPQVPIEKLVVLGLRRKKTRYSRIGRPERAPGVAVAGVNGATLRLRLFDRAHPGRSGMPVGVGQALLYVRALDDAAPGGGAWRFIGATTRARCRVSLGNQFAAGQRLWVSAQWINPRGECSPFAAPALAIVHYPEIALGGNRRWRGGSLVAPRMRAA